MTSKQRAYLRGLANTMETIMQIGKHGVTPETVEALDEMLESRELVKLNVLQNCDMAPAEAADALSGRTRAETVQVIGRKIVLFRQNREKPGIKLPKP